MRLPADDLTTVLDEIQGRVDAATPGPWETTQDKCWGEPYTGLTIQRVQEFWDSDPAQAGCDPLEDADAEFIARARADVPMLLAAVRAALSLVERWQEAGDHPAAALSAGQAADILRAALTSALTGEVGGRG